jgi:diketogulonate reductase-like aldo/keto reductase
MVFHLARFSFAGQHKGKLSENKKLFVNANELRGIAVIPKSNNKARLQQNLEVNNFRLQDAELGEISALDKSLRFNDPGFYLEKPIRIFD